MAYKRALGLTGIDIQQCPLTDYVVQQNTMSNEVYSQLDLPDAMTRYQEELLNMRVPEKKPRDDNVDYSKEIRHRSRQIMNALQFGDIRGDQDLAYKPEIEQTPQPSKIKKETKYDLFQEEKQISARYGWRGEAQKDSITNNPNHEPKYKHSDTRKYIPGYIRTAPKITIEDKEVPMYGKSNIGKPVQQFRIVDNIWALQYCKDTCKARESKTKNKTKSGGNPRHRVEGIKPDTTNVNLMFTMIKGEYDRTKRLIPDVEINVPNVETKNVEKPKESAKRKYIDFGKFIEMNDFVNIVEKVNNIDKAIKREMGNRPVLGFSTIEPSEPIYDENGIEQPREQVKRSNTFFINPNPELHSNPNEKEKSIIREREKIKRQTRNNSYEVRDTDEDYSTKGREKNKIKRESLRKLMVDMKPITENELSVTQKYNKTQKNLTKYIDGIDLSDSTKVNSFGRCKNNIKEDYRTYRRNDEFAKNYDVQVEEIQAKAFKNKGKQYRFVNPEKFSINENSEMDIVKKRNIKQMDSRDMSKNEFLMKQRLNE